MKTIGVLGGMGPHASLEFYRMLIEMSISEGANNNETFPHILISNLPVPDFIEDRSREEEAVQMVEREAKVLEQAGADFLVIVCNTMHIHLSRFKSAVDIPILSMITLIADRVCSDGIKTVGLLGSPTTIQSRLYQDLLLEKGVTSVIPTASDQDRVTGSIFAAVAGNVREEHRSSLLEVVGRFSDAGAEAVLLGCTELPSVLQGVPETLPVYKSISILAEETCNKSYS